MGCRAKKRVAVAVSGGVDSLCALWMLKHGEHEILAVHGLFLSGASPSPMLEQICARLRIPFHCLDLKKEFADEVIGPYAAMLMDGLTPNPCALCNRKIKFGLLRSKALGLGADAFATGHYANLVPNPFTGLPMPSRAADFHKDQSYFLSLASQSMLESVIFPLAHICKSKTRQIVANAGLPLPTTKESQDICFKDDAPGLDIFLSSSVSISSAGPILLAQASSGVPPGLAYRPVGTHAGLWKYTIGQRKGLGIPFSEPLYVIGKNVRKNVLIVGTRHMLAMSGCTAGKCNFFMSPERWPEKLFARLRYGQRPEMAVVQVVNDKLEIRLRQPVFPTAPGQIAVICNAAGDILAGSVVEKINFARQEFS